MTRIELFLPLAAIGLGAALMSCAAAPSSPQASPPSAGPALETPMKSVPAAEGNAEAAPQAPRATSTEREPRYARPPAGSQDQSTMGGAPGASRGMVITNLMAELDTAEAQILSAGGQCFDACRALRSMQRVVSRLCAMASDDGEHRRCQSAENRYRAAQDRVREACHRCTDGPSLEPNSPIEEPSEH